jgi:ribulose-phosphate 3-epimerase
LSKAQIAPSMMCCDPLVMEQTLAAFEASGIEYLHIDVMDGVYVPNYTLGTDYVRMLRKHTCIPMDIHLMVVNPETKLDWFDLQPGDYVSVHYESTPHIHRAISRIHSAGAKAMLALNPGTPLCVVEELLPELEGILLMTVDPGFAGQKLIEPTLEKIARLKAWLAEMHCAHIEIEVDGNVNLPNARRMREAGADIFVAGSSGLFQKEVPMKEAIARLRNAILD